MGKRKIELNTEDHEKIKMLASRGTSISDIADYLGISKATLDRRIAENTELRQLIHSGRIHSNLEVSNIAFQMATSGKFPQMTMFWLKSKAGWKDNPTEVSTDSEESKPKLIVIVKDDKNK